MRGLKNFYSIGLISISMMIGLIGNSMVASSVSAEKIITISTGDYAPWTGEDVKYNGFTNHVIVEAFKRKGYLVKYKYRPWKRAYLEAKAGKFHAVSFFFVSEERKKFFYYSDPIHAEKLVFFHLKSNPMKDWESLDDLRDYYIGATREYTYTKEFWEAAESKQLKVQITDTDQQLFSKLLKGRIDIFPSGLVNGYGVLQKEFDTSISHLISFHPKPLSETTGHLLFPKNRKDSEKLLKVFNQGLAELKKEGLYGKLMDDLLSGKYIQ